MTLQFSACVSLCMWCVWPQVTLCSRGLCSWARQTLSLSRNTHRHLLRHLRTHSHSLLAAHSTLPARLASYCKSRGIQHVLWRFAAEPCAVYHMISRMHLMRRWPSLNMRHRCGSLSKLYWAVWCAQVWAVHTPSASFDSACVSNPNTAMFLSS